MVSQRGFNSCTRRLPVFNANLLSSVKLAITHISVDIEPAEDTKILTEFEIFNILKIISVNLGVGEHYIGNLNHSAVPNGQRPSTTGHVNVAANGVNKHPLTGGQDGNLPAAITGAGLAGGLPAVAGGQAGSLPAAIAGGGVLSSSGGHGAPLSGGHGAFLPGPMGAAASLVAVHSGTMGQHPPIPMVHSNTGTQCIGPECSAKNGLKGGMIKFVVA